MWPSVYFTSLLWPSEQLTFETPDPCLSFKFSETLKSILHTRTVAFACIPNLIAREIIQYQLRTAAWYVLCLASDLTPIMSHLGLSEDLTSLWMCGMKCIVIGNTSHYMTSIFPTFIFHIYHITTDKSPSKFSVFFS